MSGNRDIPPSGGIDRLKATAVPNQPRESSNLGSASVISSVDTKALGY